MRGPLAAIFVILRIEIIYMKTKHFLILFLFSFNIFLNGQNGLIGSYPFNGNTGDYSGNGNNGIPNNVVPTNDRFGNSSSAYYFDGISSFIDLGNNINFSSHSYSCWAKRDSISGNTLISKINNGPFDLRGSEFSVNVLTLGDANQWLSVNSTAPQEDSVWNCYIATYDAISGVAKIYVNGLLDSAVILNYSDVTNTPMYIGARPFWSGVNGSAFFFRGTIDEVNIYNRVLTQFEIDSICSITTNSTNSISAKQKLRVFPNPSTLTESINFSLELENAQVTLYNNYGNELQTIDNFNGSHLPLDKQKLDSGIFWLKITKNNKILFSEKIILISDK